MHPCIPPRLTFFTVFSKVSWALRNGPRLENLSWRMWYREAHVLPPEMGVADLLAPSPTLLSLNNSPMVRSRAGSKASTPVPSLTRTAQSSHTTSPPSTSSASPAFGSRPRVKQRNRAIWAQAAPPVEFPSTERESELETADFAAAPARAFQHACTEREAEFERQRRRPLSFQAVIESLDLAGQPTSAADAAGPDPGGTSALSRKALFDELRKPIPCSRQDSRGRAGSTVSWSPQPEHARRPNLITNRSASAVVQSSSHAPLSRGYTAGLGDAEWEDDDDVCAEAEAATEEVRPLTPAHCATQQPREDEDKEVDKGPPEAHKASQEADEWEDEVESDSQPTPTLLSGPRRPVSTQSDQEATVPAPVLSPRRDAAPISPTEQDEWVEDEPVAPTTARNKGRKAKAKAKRSKGDKLKHVDGAAIQSTPPAPVSQPAAARPTAPAAPPPTSKPVPSTSVAKVSAIQETEPKPQSQPLHSSRSVSCSSSRKHPETVSRDAPSRRTVEAKLPTQNEDQWVEGDEDGWQEETTGPCASGDSEAASQGAKLKVKPELKPQPRPRPSLTEATAASVEAPDSQPQPTAADRTQASASREQNEDEWEEEPARTKAARGKAKRRQASNHGLKKAIQPKSKAPSIEQPKSVDEWEEDPSPTASTRLTEPSDTPSRGKDASLAPRKPAPPMVQPRKASSPTPLPSVIPKADSTASVVHPPDEPVPAANTQKDESLVDQTSAKGKVKSPRKGSSGHLRKSGLTMTQHAGRKSASSLVAHSAGPSHKPPAAAAVGDANAPAHTRKSGTNLARLKSQLAMQPHHPPMAATKKAKVVPKPVSFAVGGEEESGSETSEEVDADVDADEHQDEAPKAKPTESPPRAAQHAAPAPASVRPPVEADAWSDDDQAPESKSKSKKVKGKKGKGKAKAKRAQGSWDDEGAWASDATTESVKRERRVAAYRAARKLKEDELFRKVPVPAALPRSKSVADVSRMASPPPAPAGLSTIFHANHDPDPAPIPVRTTIPKLSHKSATDLRSLLGAGLRMSSRPAVPTVAPKAASPPKAGNLKPSKSGLALPILNVEKSKRPKRNLVDDTAPPRRSPSPSHRPLGSSLPRMPLLHQLRSSSAIPTLATQAGGETASSPADHQSRAVAMLENLATTSHVAARRPQAVRAKSFMHYPNTTSFNAEDGSDESSPGGPSDHVAQWQAQLQPAASKKTKRTSMPPSSPLKDDASRAETSALSASVPEHGGHVQSPDSMDTANSSEDTGSGKKDYLSAGRMESLERTARTRAAGRDAMDKAVPRRAASDQVGPNRREGAPRAPSMLGMGSALRPLTSVRRPPGLGMTSINSERGEHSGRLAQRPSAPNLLLNRSTAGHHDILPSSSSSESEEDVPVPRRSLSRTNLAAGYHMTGW